MADKTNVPIGVRLSTDIEYRPDRPIPYRARVRWTDPTSKRRQSLSEGKDSEEEAQEWLQAIIEAAHAGLSPSLATMKLAEYGEANMDLALRGLELKTLDPYLSGWRMHVVPALGHLAVRMITNGVVDRTVQNWIADEHSRSTVKNTIAVLVRVMEQAGRSSSHWPMRSWPPPTTSTAAGETWSSSPRAPPHGSARSQAAASETSTPPSGSGPCGVRPHPRPAG
ncbi:MULTISPECIES: hypothetical protein [unclassified Streptomyces]|uniref:hypothetical protein n=1 Tax=unclassified Streptomyces TaxID=2593676 RepID=UPI0027E316AF|nr:MULTISPECIES: hypothetical protein [unclassified Streptomyces]